MMTIEEACEIMHDAYEAAAVSAGWETQERSRKPWSEVPEANKETMRAAVRALLFAVTPEIKAEALEEASRAASSLGTWSGSHIAVGDRASTWLAGRAAAMRNPL